MATRVSQFKQNWTNFDKLKENRSIIKQIYVLFENVLQVCVYVAIMFEKWLEWNKRAREEKKTKLDGNITSSKKQTLGRQGYKETLFRSL